VEKDFEVFLEGFCDFLNSLEASIVEMKQQIAKLTSGEQMWTWNPENIKWTRTEGAKGEYEKSEDADSQDFKALVKDLNRHAGKLRRDSWFYWLFKDGSAVGRKKREA